MSEQRLDELAQLILADPAAPPVAVLAAVRLRIFDNPRPLRDLLLQAAEKGDGEATQSAEGAGS